MLKGLGRKTAFLFGSSAVASKIPDDSGHDSLWYNLLPSFFSRESTLSKVNAQDKPLSGWDRLCIMYSRDEFGYLSKELNAILYSTYTSFLFGGLVGVLRKTKAAHDEFLERNQATQFANVFEARRTMQNKVMLAGFKGFFTYGPKIALFSGGILCFAISLMVYTNGMSVLHYGTAGAIMGSFSKWKLGPRGIYAGAVVGGTFGLMAGGLTKFIFYLTGTSVEDVISYQDYSIRYRQSLLKEPTQKSIESDSEFIHLLKQHDESVLAEEAKDKNLSSSPEKDKSLNHVVIKK